MCRVLVVDDHPDQVESILTLVDWGDMGISSVVQAYSGKEAWKLLQQEQCEIVVTDIRMPEMDGLELIGLARARGMQTKFILMSGYADFEYARKAIQYKTVNYLMKPIDPDDLHRTLRQTIEELREERSRDLSYHKAMYTMRENIPKLRSALLRDILYGRVQPGEALFESVSRLDIPFAPDHAVTMLLIRMEEQFEAYHEKHIALFEYAITNMAEEILGETYETWCCKDEHHFLVFALKPKCEGTLAQQLQDKAKLLQRKVSTYLKGKISILFIQEWGIFPDSIKAYYDTASTAMRKHMRYEKEFVVAVGKEPIDMHIDSMKTIYQSPLLIQLMESGQWERAEERMQAILDELQDKWLTSTEHMHDVLQVLSSSLTYIAHRHGKQLKDILGEEMLDKAQNRTFRSMKELRLWCEQAFQRVKHQAGGSGSKPSVIERVHQFIEQQLSNDVSLQAIAEYVNLHPVYLSKIYKVETGISLSDYILNFRLGRAAELLKHKEVKIYEVGEQVGYQTTHYFIRVFKKRYGMTPQEYRETMI
ncbi:response regulator [Paenibacillus sp. IB182496]|uniref:Response regulator n=1 Tax=Paenibacillus sabuli TaxID=2772509 RepID=A0A927BWD6_9BACL|nr:response regulator [Paenibacillus sabuli]MBD2848098.1 response regulator [Paenibacillus sabuli]